jgi:NADH-quinone oxidoreductase subunit M
MGLPLLSILIFLPLVGASALIFVPEYEVENMKKAALWTALTTFIWSLVVAAHFDYQSSSFQLIESNHWLAYLGASYTVGIDGLSLYLVLLTTFLIPLCLLVSWDTIKTKVKLYLALFLILETFILGSFLALNLILFYVFFEGVLVPMFFLIGIWGGNNRIYASFKFFLYTMLGSVLMLVAIMVILRELGTVDLIDDVSRQLSLDMQILVWICFFTSFAIKIPMWPFHTWLPDAHVQAPTAGSAILAGVLLKMGGYGFLRFSFFYTPHIQDQMMFLIFSLSVIAVIYTSLIALVQTNIKKLVAYSSIAHMGVVTMGIFSGSVAGMSGSVFHMISHGLVSAALFICIGILYNRTKTLEISDYGGLAKVMPIFSLCLMIFIFASIGVPGTSGFIGEMFIIFASYKYHIIWAAGIATGLVIGAAYSLKFYRGVALGALQKKALQHLSDLTKIEKTALIPIVILILFLGFSPMILLKTITVSMEHTYIQWQAILNKNGGKSS